MSDSGETTKLMIASDIMSRQGYFEGSAWQRDAVANTVDSRNQSTTINQTINISGGGNPEAVARSVTESTKALVKTRNRGIV